MRRRVLLALGVLLLIVIFVTRIAEEMGDFEVNYRAGARLLRGENLYQTSDGHYMFKYFPSSALLYIPLSFLPLPAAKAFWYALTILCSVFLFVLSKRIVWGESSAPWYLLALPPLVLMKFLVVEIKLGQINTLVTLVLLWMVSARSEARAGAWWGVATAMKPYGLIFLPYYVVRLRFAALSSGLGVLAAALLLPAAFYGFEGNLEVHRAWYRTLSQSTPPQLAVADNISIAAFCAKWWDRPDLALYAVLGISAAILLMIRWGKDLPRALVLEAAALLVLIPLVSPLGWDYQLLISALALTLLARHWSDFSKPFQWLLALDLAVVGLSIYDLIGRTAYQAFMGRSILTICYLVVLGYLGWLRRWRLA